MPLPGRVPGHREETHLVISSSVTKKQIWELYSNVCHKADFQPVGYSLFLDLWNSLLPWIVIAKPSSDLCWTCQKFSESIAANPNLHDTEKVKLVEEYQQHLFEVKQNREYYKSQTEEGKRSFETLEQYSSFTLSAPCSFNGVGHYSWD